MIFPSFKQIARRLSRVERICETNADEIFDEPLFDRDSDVVLETRKRKYEGIYLLLYLGALPEERRDRVFRERGC